MRRQGLHDLAEATNRLSALTDQRRARLFCEACRLAKYAVHGVITEEELRSQLLSAAAANGSLIKHGRRWADGVIERALVSARHDDLPPLAKCFAQGGRRQ
jgi:hypothetical protein